MFWEEKKIVLWYLLTLGKIITTKAEGKYPEVRFHKDHFECAYCHKVFHFIPLSLFSRSPFLVCSTNSFTNSWRIWLDKNTNVTPKNSIAVLVTYNYSNKSQVGTDIFCILFIHSILFQNHIINIIINHHLN